MGGTVPSRYARLDSEALRAGGGVGGKGFSSLGATGLPGSSEMEFGRSEVRRRGGGAGAFGFVLG